MENDSRPSGPTLDLHTDAIILREGPGAVCSTYLRGSSTCPTVTPTPTPTSIGSSVATPTSSERSPFLVRKTAFRAAPAIITVGPSPAMQRVQIREAAAKTGRAVGAAEIAPPGTGLRAQAEASLPWPVLAALAIGAGMAFAAQVIGDRAGELAAFVAVLAGLRTLAAGIPGKSRAQTSRSRGH
ncbi:MAG: hypothetical protein JWO86_3689 [Myxococcaceae bacterium]|nr:hypothetical protein [Myxococcaceae bacterium]MEA2747285.1 hypothetical protein [Myxococcales bacterium]